MTTLFNQILLPVSFNLDRESFIHWCPLNSIYVSKSGRL